MPRLPPTLALVVTTFALLALAGCGSLTPGGALSPGTAGAPATSTAAAQTVGQDQAAVGGTATGGTGTINWYFASQASSAVQMEILAMAAAQGWSAAETIDAVKATNGSPESVTITNENVTNAGGNADNAGAGTGGAGGSTGSIPPR